MSALPKGWVDTEDGARHAAGMFAYSTPAGFATDPWTKEHPTLDAAIAALEPHVEAWREAVREAIGQTVKPVAERNPLVDPAVGDVLVAVMPDVSVRVYRVTAVGGGSLPDCSCEVAQGGKAWTASWMVCDWRNWPEGWTVTIVRRGAP
jgi:hypothetical protein